MPPNSELSFTICCCRGIYQTVPIYGASTTVQRAFHEGTHYVEYKAVDESGNFDSCSFSVTVNGECSRSRVTVLP